MDDPNLAARFLVPALGLPARISICTNKFDSIPDQKNPTPPAAKAPKIIPRSRACFTSW